MHHELLDSEWESGGVKKYLELGGQEVDDGVEHAHKVLRQQLVRLLGWMQH